MQTEEILSELSDRIAEIYDLDLAEEMTEIFENLTEKFKAHSDRYWRLIGKLARIETQRDELRNELEKEREPRKEDVNCLSKELEEERDARTQAESEIEILKERLEEERRLRVDAEYDKEYYAMRLMEHMD